MEESIFDSIKIHKRLLEDFEQSGVEKIKLISEKIYDSLNKDGAIYICGNGGSAADSQHIAAEFVNRYILERPPLPALALTTDTSIITSVGNNYSFGDVFSKQVKALGMEGDVLLALSTSGDSENIVSAVDAARSQGIYTAGFLGGDGGKLAKLVDLALVAKSRISPRIQEAHILAGHMLCHLVDYILFERHLPNES